MNFFKRRRVRQNNEYLCGGWSKPENKELSPQLMEIFSSAVRDSEYSDLEAISLEGTQVVAGLNYRFLCHKKDTDEYYLVRIYRNLEQECSVTSVEKQK